MKFGITPMPLARHTVDTRLRYALLFTNHGDTDPPASPERERWRAGGDRANREPARRVRLQAKRGEEIAALRARSSNRVVSCQWLDPD